MEIFEFKWNKWNTEYNGMLTLFIDFLIIFLYLELWFVNYSFKNKSCSIEKSQNKAHHSQCYLIYKPSDIVSTVCFEMFQVIGRITERKWIIKRRMTEH